jgi:hypothetical protein
MSANDGLWICGDSRVQLISSDPADRAVAWMWDSATAQDIPAERRDWLHAIDEVKPVVHAGEPCLLLTASWRGAVALLRRRDRRVLFLAPLPNAHSADLLPDGWVVAAGSVGSDCLHVHRVSAGVMAGAPRLALPLFHGHGVVFSPGDSRVWVCGGPVIRAYRWSSSDDTCALELEREIALPDADAHDLIADDSCVGLIVTTRHGVWRYDTVTGVVAPYARLMDKGEVKSMAFIGDGTLAYVQAAGNGVFSSEEVVMVGKDGAVRRRAVPGGYLYKARSELGGLPLLALARGG